MTDSPRTELPEPIAPFHGHIGERATESTPDFPTPPTPPDGAPNVLLIMLDDVGFGASKTFGGPIDTPTADRIAARGVKYNTFHTTAMCSPTRAALLNGRNHHSVHTGQIMEMATGYPGYDSVVAKDTVGIGEILRQNGWNTAWFGKNHNVPDWESSQAGPFDRWPTGLGFERFYGFIGGDMNHWRPNVFDGTQPIEPYVGKPDYNLDYDLADKAIDYVRLQHSMAPDKPFLLYYAPGATHAPHHPRQEWVDKYTGKFDMGWDELRNQTLARQKAMGIVPPDTELTARSEGIQAWDSLDENQKTLFIRMMEIYAGFLEQADYNVGRVVDAIEQIGELDNTLIIYIIGDNGASAEGQLEGAVNLESAMNGVVLTAEEMLPRIDELGTWKTYNHYPVGWAHALDAPFQWTKQIASHYGGTRNGMVLSWPDHIDEPGGLRNQWHHVIDILPTILDVVGVPQPTKVNGVEQRPIEGVSMRYTFNQPHTESARRTKYFELFGNRDIYHDGWIAATTPAGPPWSSDLPILDPITGYDWELYHVAEDFSEARDVSAQHPEKLAEMQDLFYEEARKYHVLPIDNDRVQRLNPINRPSLAGTRTSFTYYAGAKRIPEGVAPDIKNKSWSLSADISVPDGGAEGMIVTLGGLFNGWALYLDHGIPTFHYNFGDVAHYHIAGSEALQRGNYVIGFEFDYDGGGIGRGGTGILSVNEREIARGRIERTVANRFTMSVETFDIGEDTGTPVNLDYDVPFHFTGTIDTVTIDLHPQDAITEAHVHEAKRRSGIEEAMRD